VSEAESVEGMRRRLDVVLPEPRIFDNIAREKFRFVRTTTVEAVVAMLGTYSTVIVATPGDRSRRLAQSRAAVEERFPGADTIDVPMRAWCCGADRIPRGGPQ
jgi:hypothetical protein